RSGPAGGVGADPAAPACEPVRSWFVNTRSRVMPEIAPGIHLNLPGEQHSPYQWGGEATHGETNPIRNYMDACQDAAEAAPFLADHDDGGVPSTQYWQTQVHEAERIVEAFDDIGAEGIPTVIPSEFVELQQKLRVERPDLHTQLSIDRNGLPA